MKTLDELRKGLNGKLIRVVLKGEGKQVAFPAIMICPPDGKKISYKPYGQKAEKIQASLDKVGLGRSIEEIKEPTFCYATTGLAEENRSTLEQLDALDNNARVDLARIFYNNDMGKRTIAAMLGGNPSCSYGS
jgi:hypothetical protein